MNAEKISVKVLDAPFNAKVMEKQTTVKAFKKLLIMYIQRAAERLSLMHTKLFYRRASF